MAEDWKDKLAGAFGIDPLSYAEENAVEEEKPQSAGRTSHKETLVVAIDRRHRSGKQVTLVSGFNGSDDELESLGRLLRGKCGAGGSVKDGEIIVQGDFRDKVVKILQEEGFRAKRGN